MPKSCCWKENSRVAAAVCSVGPDELRRNVLLG